MSLKGHGGHKTTGAKSHGGYKANGANPKANNARGKQHIATMSSHKKSFGMPKHK
ncbi:MAG TPA: hypothetical protein VK808_05260 [Bacteroidia bacterium]|jgi:hypothetical protein|nr:hypothetical protein [Bacteroidia bacterium]